MGIVMVHKEEFRMVAKIAQRGDIQNDIQKEFEDLFVKNS